MQPTTPGTDTTPAPDNTPLLGFVQRLESDSRYAIYPLGRYTRACVEDWHETGPSQRGCKLLGFIDDDTTIDSFQGHPVAPLHVAARDWPIDALILTRDTHDGAIRKRIAEYVQRGILSPSVRLIDQPAPTIDAMTAHLGTYHPSCAYEPEFIETCRSLETSNRRDCDDQSWVVCTMDADVFPMAGSDSALLYARVMSEICRRMLDSGFSLSLCVQLNDTPGVSEATPGKVVEEVIDAFGPDAIELHGLDHAMPVEGYSSQWFTEALEGLRSRFGAACRYWAPPGWNLSWRSLRALSAVPQIKAVRGIWTGVNWRHEQTVETLRHPYRVGGLWQIPYSYVDWMFMDYWCRPCDWSLIDKGHERVAEFASTKPCMIESVVHPFRFVGGDYRKRLDLFDRTLESYRRRGIRMISAAGAMKLLDARASQSEAAPGVRLERETT